jgi:predicted transposase YbfD/YdcC
VPTGTESCWRGCQPRPWKRRRIERIIQEQDRESKEVADAITRLSPQRATAADLLANNRGHGGIENRLHWVRDVCFGEDACRANVQHCPQNLAALRNVSLALLRRAGIKEILATLRDFATQTTDLLKFLRILKQ